MHLPRKINMLINIPRFSGGIFWYDRLVTSPASAKQVRRAMEKQLITVFREAMSRVASRSRRVYRADDMRHKSGRGMRCAGQKLGYGFKVCTNLHVYLRATAIPRALRGAVCEPLARIIFLQIRTHLYMQVGSVLCGARTGICSALQGFRHGSGGAMLRIPTKSVSCLARRWNGQSVL